MNDKSRASENGNDLIGVIAEGAMRAAAKIYNAPSGEMAPLVATIKAKGTDEAMTILTNSLREVSASRIIKFIAEDVRQMVQVNASPLFMREAVNAECIMIAIEAIRLGAARVQMEAA